MPTDVHDERTTCKYGERTNGHVIYAIVADIVLSFVVVVIVVVVVFLLLCSVLTCF